MKLTKNEKKIEELFEELNSLFPKSKLWLYTMGEDLYLLKRNSKGKKHTHVRCIVARLFGIAADAGVEMHDDWMEKAEK